MKVIYFVILFPLHVLAMHGPLIPSLKERCIQYLIKQEPTYESLQKVLPQDLMEEIDAELFGISLSFVEREMYIFPLYMRYNVGPSTYLDVMLYSDMNDLCVKVHLGKKKSYLLILRDKRVLEEFSWFSTKASKKLMELEEFTPKEVWATVPKEILMDVAFSLRRG